MSVILFFCSDLKPHIHDSLIKVIIIFYQKFNTYLYTRRAKEIVENNGRKKPFFIYLSLFTKSYPRFAKSGKVKLSMRLKDHKRQLKRMDIGIKKLVRALKDNGHYDNTILWFISDNGGPIFGGHGDENNPNYPLNGKKGTVYEGGTKVPMFIHSPMLRTNGLRYGTFVIWIMML